MANLLVAGTGLEPLRDDACGLNGAPQAALADFLEALVERPGCAVTPDHGARSSGPPPAAWGPFKGAC